MITEDIKQQLKTHFEKLNTEISLNIDKSNHDKQGELEQLLSDVAQCSSKISVVQSNIPSEFPQFSVSTAGVETGIRFIGVPGGHEFSSFILAILNSGGVGKLPDQGLINRIAKLKIPGPLTTYVSLSCENCPDVVQALNIISIFNRDAQHTMVDGGVATSAVEARKIASVPAVFLGDEMIHSGRGTLANLIDKLETNYGSHESSSNDVQELKEYDVAVIGGGPAGASAAIYTARKGLKTVIIADKIGGQMLETRGIENMISVVYTEGPKLSANLEKHVKSYDIDLLENRRVDTITPGSIKNLTLRGGERIDAKKVIIATGAQWRQLNVPGEVEYLGRGVAYCPHCDGPFYKGKNVAVVGGGNSGVEAAIDLSGICAQVTLFEFLDELKADQVLIKKLRETANIRVITGAKTSEVIGNGEKVTDIKYEDRKTGVSHNLSLDGIFVQIGLVPNSKLVNGIVDMNKFGEIIVDEKGRTSSHGIYAAGDVTTTPFKQIIIALGDGAKVGLTAFEDNMHESS